MHLGPSIHLIYLSSSINNQNIDIMIMLEAYSPLHFASDGTIVKIGKIVNQ